MLNSKFRDGALEIIRGLISTAQPRGVENVATAALQWRNSPAGRAAAQKQRTMISELEKSLTEARRLGNTTEARSIEQQLRDTRQRDLKEFDETARRYDQQGKIKSDLAQRLELYTDKIKRAYSDQQVAELVIEALRLR